MRAKTLVATFAWLSLVTALNAFGGVNAWTLHGPVGGGGAVSAVAVHPTDGSIALASTPRGIYRSSDGAQTWTLVNAELRNSARRIVFDPSNPSRVAACDGQMYLSSNTGQTFGVLQGPNTPDAIINCAFAKDGTLYALSSMAALYKSSAPFSSWTSVGGGWPAGSVPNFLTTDPLNSQILYVSIYSRGVYRSQNGGSNWALLAGGLPSAATTTFTGLDVDPTNSSRLLMATGGGIFMSPDSGASWTTQYLSAALWIGFDPEDPNTALAVGFTNVFRSGDRGQNWTQEWAHRNEAVANAGFIPGNTGGVLLGLSAGIAYSTNNGTSFDYRNTGLAGFTPRLLVASDDAVYAAMAVGFGDVYRRNGTNYVPLDYLQTLGATGDQRLFTSLAVAAGDSNQIFAVNLWSQLIRTFDRGATWDSAHQAFFPPAGDYINDVQIDPNNPQVAYVGRKLTGVWKTANGGNTFTHLVNSPNYIGKLAVSPHDGSVYATSGPNNQTGIYKSPDGGNTWVEQVAPMSLTDRNFMSFTFHPVNPQVVYAVAQGILGNLWRTTNGGTSWQAVSLASSGETFLPAYSLLLDPLVPTTMFLVSTGSAPGFMRSVDGGATWEKTPISVPGQATTLGAAVLDPANPATLIAITSGAGIAEYQVSPDLALSMSTMSPPLATGSTASATFTISNRGPHASSASELQVNVPAWLTPSAPGCTYNAPTLRCPLTAMQVNASRSVQVGFAVGASPQGSANIDATLTGHEMDSQTANNIAAQSVSTSEQANLALGFAVSRSTLEPGESMTLTMSVANQGPSPSTQTTLDLPLPAGIEVTGHTTAHGSCAVTAGTFHCDLGTVPVGTSWIVTADLRATTPGTRDISAHADGAGADSGGLHTNHFVLRALPIGDLSVSLAESADPVAIGEDFSYTLAVKNDSGDPAGAVATVSVTGTSIFRLVSTSGMTCPGGLPTQVINCEIISLPAGSTATAVFGATALLPGIATAGATVTHSGRDTNPDNNAATIGTTLRLVGDLSVEISDSADPASVSVPFQYTATVRNAGPNNGAVNIAIPVTGANISSAAISVGSCTTTAGTATCTIPQLDSGGSQVITITALATVPGTASATATATFVGFDSNTANNSATAQTVVRAVADIGVTIAESVEPVTAGGSLSYLVTLTTAGPSPGNVHLTVPVTGSTVTGATPSQGGSCTFAAGSVTCDFAPMDLSPSTVNILINSTTAGTVTATATATFSGTDPVATNNTATATTTVNPAPSSSSSSGGGSSGGGGGGGRFDWLALGLLGLLLASRGWFPASARR